MSTHVSNNRDDSQDNDGKEFALENAHENTSAITGAEGLQRMLAGTPLFPDNDSYHPGFVARFLAVKLIDMGNGKVAVSDTIGYVHPFLLEEEAFWTSMILAGDGVIEVLESDSEPHSGIVCEYSGEEIEAPWFIVGNGVGGASLYDYDETCDDPNVAVDSFFQMAEGFIGDGDDEDPADFVIASAQIDTKIDRSLLGNGPVVDVKLFVWSEETPSGNAYTIEIREDGRECQYTHDSDDTLKDMWDLLDTMHAAVCGADDDDARFVTTVKGSIDLIATEGRAQRRVEVGQYAG